MLKLTLANICGNSFSIGSCKHVLTSRIAPCQPKQFISTGSGSQEKCDGNSSPRDNPELAHSNFLIDKLVKSSETLPYTPPTAPVSAGGNWCGPCLMDLQPVPCGSYKEGYKKFQQQRLIWLGVGSGSLTLAILTLYNMDLLLRKKS